jgi:hypothetical protein
LGIDSPEVASPEDLIHAPFKAASSIRLTAVATAGRPLAPETFSTDGAFPVHVAVTDTSGLTVFQAQIAMVVSAKPQRK